MNTTPPPKNIHRWLFWLILAAFSTYFAEVFSGADMFPFFHVWGIFIILPLYGLHSLLLAHLVYRAEKPLFSSLIFAGMIFGLYEAYLTKVLWDPPWGEALIIGGVAPIETLVLVLWWHVWFSFILPLVVLEGLLTSSDQLRTSFPGRIRRFLFSWRGLALLMVFGGIFQSINSPSVERSLLSGISTTGVLVGLVLVWKRLTREHSYTMKALLPGRKEFRLLLLPTGLLYLGLGVILRPEALPGPIGHAVIWLLYGVSFLLFFRSQQKIPPAEEGEEAGGLQQMPSTRWLLLAGIFPLAAAAGELLLAPIAEPLALFFWFAGILFGLIMFLKALRSTLQKRGVVQHA